MLARRVRRSPHVDASMPQWRLSVVQSIDSQPCEALIIISTSHHGIISGNGMPIMDILIPSTVNLSAASHLLRKSHLRRNPRRVCGNIWLRLRNAAGRVDSPRMRASQPCVYVVNARGGRRAKKGNRLLICQPD